MLTKFVKPGTKLSIQRIDQGKDEAHGPDGPPHYETKVYEILSDSQLEVFMPMVQMKLVLLPLDGRYSLYFTTPKGFYQCDARIIDRYKVRTSYILLLEMTTNLRKYQKREYYRLSCTLNMDSRALSLEELAEFDSDHADPALLSPELPLKRSIVLDISGGGLRFIANYAYEIGMLIHCRYTLDLDGRHKEYNLLGKVLLVQQVAGRTGVYEHRVQYVDINTDEREEIIRFIFEEERKARRKERWG